MSKSTETPQKGYQMMLQQAAAPQKGYQIVSGNVEKHRKKGIKTPFKSSIYVLRPKFLRKKGIKYHHLLSKHVEITAKRVSNRKTEPEELRKKGIK